MAGKQESKYKENEANFDHHINEEQKQELMGLAMTFVEKAVSRLYFKKYNFYDRYSPILICSQPYRPPAPYI